HGARPGARHRRALHRPRRRVPAPGRGGLNGIGAKIGNRDGDDGMADAVKRVLVAGYGTMGRGVALSFVRGGFETAVLSRDPSRIADLPEGATATSELPAEAPDLILENVPEKVGIKHALYRRIEDAYGGRPIVAT